MFLVQFNTNSIDDFMLVSNKYEVESLLGKGLMGEVYKVRHLRSGTLSVLKVLPSRVSDHPELWARLNRRARDMAKLKHPSIARIVDIDHDDEFKFHYLVMDYVQGRTLLDYLEVYKVMALPDVLDFARSVADALRLAHNHKPPLIHGKLSPANIMLEDGSHRAVLKDFGLLQELDQTDAEDVDCLPGLLRYRPPEQLRSEPLTGCADLYALGIVMYESYTGAQWLAGLSDQQMVDFILSDQDNQPIFADGTPVEFQILIGKLMKKNLSERYQTANELLADLEQCILLVGAGNDSERLCELSTDAVQKDEVPVAGLLDADRKTAEDIVDPGAQMVVRETDLHQPGIDEQPSSQENVLIPKVISETAGVPSFESDREFLDVNTQELARQIKLQVESAKTEADDYQAKDKAPLFYGRALTFQIQGDGFFNAGSYQQAVENFSEALRNYQDAREFAYYQTLKEDTGKLSVQVHEAHDAAVKADAKLMASVLFNQAVAMEHQARSAQDSEDFSQAYRLFRSALETYGQALQQVNDQQRQLEMLKARKESLELWHRAKQAGAEQVLAEAFAEALALKEQGQYYEEQQQPEPAADYYNRAARAFEQLQKKTESLAIKEQTGMIKVRVLDAQAEYQPFRNRAQEAWQEADSLTGKADAAWAEQQYLQARKLYAKALAAYDRAQRQSLSEQYREQAQQVQDRLQESQRVAQHCQADLHCQSLYQQAVDTETKGQTCQQHRKFQQAIAHFKQAEEWYERAALARLEQVKGEIAAVQQQSRKRQVQDYAGALYHKGLASLMAAEELREQSRLFESFDSYCEAHRLFTEAFETAKQRIIEAADEAMEMPDLLPKEEADRSQQQSTENRDHETEKAVSANRKSRGSGRYGKTANITSQASSKTELPSAEDVSSFQDKTDKSGREQRGEPHASRVSRWVGTLLLIAVILAGVWMLVDKANIGQPFGNSGSRQEFTITKVTPSEELVKLSAGQSQNFAVEVSGPQAQALTYAWYLDGSEQSKNAQWLYVPGASTTDATIREVKVVISADHDHLLAKIWKVEVVPQATARQATASQHAPKIVVAEPGEQNLFVQPNQTVFFSAEASDEDSGDQLTYSWSMDGQAVARSKSWNYKTSQSGQHEVLLTVTDQTGRQDEYAWNIAMNKPVARHPPRIVKAEPAERTIALPQGSGVNFSAEAMAADAKRTLTYTWYADRKKQSSSPAWFYKPPSEGHHKISLKVTDSEGLQSYRTWYVVAKEASAACINVDEGTDLCLPETGNKPDEMTQATAMANRPPIIKSSSPSEAKLQVLLGKVMFFSVEAADPDADDSLTYSWSLNGQEQSTNDAWPFVPQAVGEHKVTLVVADRAGKQAKRSWTVRAESPPASCIALNDRDELCMPETHTDESPVVGEPRQSEKALVSIGQNQAPSIISSQPEGTRLEVLLGRTESFSVEASDPDPDELLSYAWYLDGHLQSENPEWPYQPQAQGRHKVTLKVTDRAGKQVQRSWLVNAVSPPAQCITLEDGSELCMPVQ